VKFFAASLGALAGGAAVAMFPLDGWNAARMADAGWILAALFALITLTRAARICDARERRIWRSLAIAAGAWLIGQLVWDAYTLSGRTPPSPSVADFLWIVFPLAASVGVYRFAPIHARVRRVLDADAIALAICVGALTVAYNWSALTTSQLTISGRVTEVAYPVTYTIVVALGLGALIGMPEMLRRRDLMLAFAGIVAEGLAFGLWCPEILQGTYQQGASLLDPLWTLGLILMGAGGLAVRREVAFIPPSSDRLRRRIVLPAAGFAALIGTVIALAVGGAALAPRLTVMGAIGAMGLLLLARNWLAFAAVEELERDRALTLARRNRELEAFAYSASHDLKAPLVSIEGFVSLLERELGDELDERSRHYLTRIHANAQSMQRLITDLFAFARSGGDERTADAIDTTALAKELVEEWRDRADAAGMPLRLDGLLPSVRAHPVRLKQALTNLIDNAIRYGSGHIRVSGSTHDGVSEIVVEDGGAGVPSDDRAQMFDLFARGAANRQSVPEGTGLGLALVKRIVEASGGNVRYEHAAGTRFVLSFPTVAS
jgi:signal transduction histidine kinase